MVAVDYRDPRPDRDVYREAALSWTRGAPPVYQDKDGVYWIARRADILAALRNPEVFSQRLSVPPDGAPPPFTNGGRPLTMDDHDFFVRLLSRASLSVVMESLRKRTREVIRGARRYGAGCDGVGDVAVPLVVNVLALWFELGPKDASVDLRTLELHLAPGLVAARRRRPGGDAISRMLLGNPQLTDGEVAGLVQLSWTGITHMMVFVVFALYELGRRPELQRRLRDNPKDQRVFVEEVLRLAIGGAGRRQTTVPVTVAGVRIPAGALVELYTGGLNRDGTDETSRDELRMDGPHRHYSFGAGPRSCPAHLFVRFTLRVFVSEWLSQIPAFSVAPGFVPQMFDSDTPAPGHSLEGVLRRLPLRWSTQPI